MAMSNDIAAALPQRVAFLMQRLCYRPVRDAATFDLIGALRHRAYLAEGAIAPLGTGQLRDSFDHAPNSATIGIWLDDRLVASVRVVVVSYLHGTLSPAVEVFPELLTSAIAQGKVILDPNRLVIDPVASREWPDLIYAAFRVPFIAAGHFAADLVTATVRAEHQAFYRRRLGFRTVAGSRPYPGLLKPLCLMTARFDFGGQALLDLFPFLEARPTEAAAMFEI
jgi:hypothetical protein